MHEGSADGGVGCRLIEINAKSLGSLDIGWKSKLGPKIRIDVGLILNPVLQFKPDIISRFPSGVDVHLEVGCVGLVQNVRRNIEGQIADIIVGIAVDPVLAHNLVAVV